MHRSIEWRDRKGWCHRGRDLWGDGTPVVGPLVMGVVGGFWRVRVAA